MRITVGRVVFKCPFYLIIIYALVLTLLLNLGFWQLRRGEEKQALITQQAQQRLADALVLTATTPENTDDLRYRKVITTGHYDTEHQFLVDNQILNGKAGYFVLTPFILNEGKKAILVNRGWVAANPHRQILPNVTLKTEPTLSIKGRLNHFPSVGIKLAGAGIPTQTVPAVIQVVETAILEQKVGYALFPLQLELDSASPDGYTRQWQTTTLMPPERHKGYALQWFGLALTLTILFFWTSSKKTDDDKTTTTKS